MPSQVFGSKRGRRAHLLRGRGLSGEVVDLRSDIDEAFLQIEGLLSPANYAGELAVDVLRFIDDAPPFEYAPVSTLFEIAPVIQQTGTYLIQASGAVGLNGGAQIPSDPVVGISLQLCLDDIFLNVAMGDLELNSQFRAVPFLLQKRQIITAGTRHIQVKWTAFGQLPKVTLNCAPLTEPFSYSVSLSATKVRPL